MSAWNEATPRLAAECVHRWLRNRLTPEQLEWLDERGRPDASDRETFLAIGLTPRKVGKEDLGLDAEELAAAEAARPGWLVEDWTVDQAARLYLLLRTSASGDGALFRRRLDKLCDTGDVGEQVMLYRGLPVYPDPDSLKERAAEGIRTNIKAVFEAVAHRNPYPSERLDDAAWNQMVLKALFIGSRLHPIQGLESRANADLARTLREYAHERWAAGRPVIPELWRCVAPFADDAEALADLKRAWNTDVALEREAVALALNAAPHPGAQRLLEEDPTLAEAAKAGKLDWAKVSERL